jgi:hypothetical protein
LSTYRKPTLLAAESGVLVVRAATLYRLQYDAWQRKDPPRIAFASPSAGPEGFVAFAALNVVENQSVHYSHAFAVIE